MDVIVKGLPQQIVEARDVRCAPQMLLEVIDGESG
jgi:hypothetical protein